MSFGKLSSSKMIFLTIIALGFALRLYALDRESLWYDELLQLDIVQQPLAEILPALPRHAAVPLDYILTHFWVYLGRQEYWVRLPAVILGTLTLPAAYQLGRRLFDPAAGLLLMTLLAVSTFHVRYSQEVRPYALLVLGVTLAAYGFWQLRESGRWRYRLILQAGVILFSLSHLFALIIFGPWLVFAGVDILFSRDRQAQARPLIALIAAGGVALLILLGLGWGPTFIKVSTQLIEAVTMAKGFTLSPEEQPNNTSGPVVNANFVRFEILAPLGAGGEEGALQLFNGLAGLGLIYLLSRKQYKLATWLGLWLLLPVVGVVAFLVHRSEFFASRYIISTLPAYLMLVTAGSLALPRWLKCSQPRWLSAAALVIVLGLVGLALGRALAQDYTFKEKEDWRLIARFIEQNAGPDDAIIAVNAESTMNWYHPSRWTAPDTYDEIANIQPAVERSERSWVIMSIFVEYMGERADQIRAWLGERGAIRLVLDPLIAVYYLGPDAPPDQLLEEIQGFALPVDHALYASLARENRRRPDVAAQYLRLAIAHAPNEEIRARYQADLAALAR